MKTVALAALLGSLGLPNAPIYTDMVLVEAPRPFLIDVFELTRPNNKAYRFKNLEEAQPHCAAQKKRIPTEEEWMAAARALRGKVARNRNYTLRGDQLYRDPKNPSREGLLANVFGTKDNKDPESGSANPADAKRVGIDTVGTLGLTGNRAEFVIGAGGRIVQCGGAYETPASEAGRLKLDRLCSDKPADWPAETATVRCVADVDPAVGAGIRYSDKITPDHRAYLMQLEKERPDSNVLSELTELLRALIPGGCVPDGTPEQRLAPLPPEGPACKKP